MTINFLCQLIRRQSMDKKALRAEIRAQKRALTQAQIDSASRLLGELLRAEAC